ncbi:MAG: hypothetical protein EXS40_06500 [Opitutaceae bacterium]|nr:hypothetical protein [Opitutaceae bacterium]
MNPRPLLALLVGWLIAGASVIAQSAPTGAIEGRVFDAGRGEYLENPRVTIDDNNTYETALNNTMAKGRMYSLTLTKKF